METESAEGLFFGETIRDRRRHAPCMRSVNAITEDALGAVWGFTKFRSRPLFRRVSTGSWAAFQ